MVETRTFPPIPAGFHVDYRPIEAKWYIAKRFIFNDTQYHLALQTKYDPCVGRNMDRIVKAIFYLQKRAEKKLQKALDE